MVLAEHARVEGRRDQSHHMGAAGRRSRAQLWETSSDGGTTWKVAFDGYYTKQ
jgi:hypothetical protein